MRNRRRTPPSKPGPHAVNRASQVASMLSRPSTATVFVLERGGLAVVAAECGEIASVVGGKPLAHQIERVAERHASPMTFTTTRLRRWPSNSA